jgi:hypothetical protein
MRVATARFNLMIRMTIRDPSGATAISKTKKGKVRRR